MVTKEPFSDRTAAGNALAAELQQLKLTDPLVLALPRGAIEIGSIVADTLEGQLDVLIVGKIGAPDNPELAVGALAENDVLLINEDALDLQGYTESDLQPTLQHETNELKRRMRLFRENHPLPPMEGRSVLLVDDGIATGMTMLAAITAVKKKSPAAIIVASPVCAADTAKYLSDEVTSVVCLKEISRLRAIGAYYQSFPQVSDETVMAILKKSRQQSDQ